MEQGDVWMVSLPFSSGREQSGERPAVVVQDSIYGQGSPLVLTVPVTSQLSAFRFPGTVQIEPSVANGLTFSSIAMVFQLRALDRTRFVRRIGTLQTSDLEVVLVEIDKLLGR